MLEQSMPDQDMRTRATKRRYFPQLEGMRGIAALGVLVSETGFFAGQVKWNEIPGLTYPGNGFAGVILWQLHISLPIFFVLSGTLLYRPFVLTTLVGTPRPALGPYFWRRVLRVLPAYWAALAVTLLLFNRHAINGVWSVVRPLLLLQIYDKNGWVRGLEPSWSLSTEVVFYFTLPIFAWILHRFACRAADPMARARRILLALIIPVVVGFVYAAYTYLPSLGPSPMQDKWPPKWIGFIAIGMALATLSAAAEISPEKVPAPYRLVMRKPIVCWYGALAVFAMLCFSPFDDPGSANYLSMSGGIYKHLMYLAFSLLLVAPLTIPNARSHFINAVLTNRVMLFFGRISYGVYLWHLAVIYYWNKQVIGADGFFRLLPVVFVGSVGIATLSYFLVERPAMQLRKRLGKAPAEFSVVTIAPGDAAAPPEAADEAVPHFRRPAHRDAVEEETERR
ncbi:hypothetical protein GCM10029978_055160 [Actinoallomurus acanthiterrae]